MSAPSPLQRFVRDSGLTLLQQASTALCTLGTSILVARSLGPAGQGAYGVVFTLAVLCMTVGNLGVGPATVFYVSNGRFSAAWAARCNARLALLFSGATVALLAAAYTLGGEAWLPHIQSFGVAVAACLTPLFLLSNFLTAVLQGMQQVRAYNVASFLVPSITFVATAVGVGWLHGGVLAALAAQGCGHAVASIYAWLQTQTQTQAGGPEPGYVRAVTHYGARAYLGNTLAYLNYRLDMFLLNAWLNAAAVGLYSVAVGVGERLWLLSYAASAMLLPRIARDRGDTGHLTPIIARHVFAASALAAALLAALAPWLLPLIFGTAFADSVPSLRMLCPGLVACALSRVLSSDLAGRGRPGLNAALGAVALVTNLGANVVLIPRWGPFGAAAASSLAYSLECVLKLFVYSRHSGTALTEVMVLQRQDWTRLRHLGRALRTRGG